MKSRLVCWVGAALALSVAGCPTSSDGIDLAEQGSLTMTIKRASGSSIATVTAQVVQQGLLSSTQITLAEDQTLTVDGAALAPTPRTQLGLDAEYTSAITAVEDPDEYAITFNNQGVITTAMIAPPEGFTNVRPRSGTAISGNDGFALRWDRTAGSSATVAVSITGAALQANTETGTIEPVEDTVSLPAITDDGGITIGASQLTFFQPGQITVTLTRIETTSRKLGFAAGAIRMEIVRELTLILE